LRGAAAIACVVAGCLSVAPGAFADETHASAPRPADPARRYVFYLHGQIVEDAGRNARHPRYGAYEYDAIVRALGARGAIVEGEIRPRGTSITAYAAKLEGRLRTLLAAGVPAAHVAVVGFSKGGAIAQRVATGLDAGVRYVILAGCFGAPGGKAKPMHARVLSLREQSDRLARSCEPLFDPAEVAAGRQKELVLELGGEHGAFYRPDPRWLEPLLAFIE
jgi:hypothetical protein